MKLLSTMRLISVAVLSMASTAVANQEYTMTMTIALDGVSGNPNNTPCIQIFQDAIVAAYAAAMPDNDSQLQSLTVNSVAPGFANALRSGTTGSYVYVGSGTYSCRHCNGFLEAVSSEEAFEEILKNMLIQSKCAAYNKLESVDITYLPSNALAEQSTQLTNQEYTMTMTIALDGVSGNPNNTTCIQIFQDAIVAAYATAMPDNDSQLQSLTVNSVAPGFANDLRSGTTGSYVYVGSGTYSCRRCNGLLEAFSSEEAFEETLKNMLIQSKCAAYDTLESDGITYLPSIALAEQIVELTTKT